MVGVLFYQSLPLVLPTSLRPIKVPALMGLVVYGDTQPSLDPAYARYSPSATISSVNLLARLLCWRSHQLRQGGPRVLGDDQPLLLRAAFFRLALGRPSFGHDPSDGIKVVPPPGITHKSALFVLRRIRHGMGSDTATKLTGTVEVDELYVGGKPRYKGFSKGGRATVRLTKELYF